MNPSMPAAANALLSPESLDPWAALIGPALRRDRGRVLDLVDTLTTLTPAALRGRLDAVAARAFFALGLIRLAEKHLERALGQAAPEAMALATLCMPDGEIWAARRLGQGSPGDRADAACDLAFLALRDGCHQAARGFVDRALAGCPHHAESRRWHRFLVDAGASAPRRLGRADGGREPVDLDGWELAPRSDQGWLSAERWLRRLASGCWTARASSGEGDGLTRLRDLGVTTRLLALDEDYARLRSDHPLVMAERAFDQALTLDREGRPAGEAAETAWTAASLADEEALRDAAGGLVALGVRNPSAARTGLVAAELLRCTEPGQPLWPAYEARLLASIGDGEKAICLARSQLRRPVDPVTLALCIDTLRRCEEHGLALQAAREALKEPRLEGTARHLLSDWDHPRPLAPMVSDRMRPRFPSLPRS